MYASSMIGSDIVRSTFQPFILLLGKGGKGGKKQIKESREHEPGVCKKMVL
jgi:hypothetical protein